MTKAKMAREDRSIVRVSKDVIGKKVVNHSQESIGEIHEVMVDAAEGHVTYAILSFGGFLGIGDKLFAVPWPRLEYDPENDLYVMKADKKLLENAPGFDKNKWPDMSNPDQRSEIYIYYESEPYWE